jgi:hypothetical protein
MYHEYKAVQPIKDGPFFLEKDGHRTTCPKTVYVLQENNGISGPRIIEQRMPCNTGCPLAEIKEMTTRELFPDQTSEIPVSVYEISCEGGCKRVLLSKIVSFEEPEKPNIPIIGLHAK